MNLRHEPRMSRYAVFVHGVGYVGYVSERNEELARCAALSKYGAEGERDKHDIADPNYIYSDDEFDVRPA